MEDLNYYPKHPNILPIKSLDNLNTVLLKDTSKKINFISSNFIYIIIFIFFCLFFYYKYKSKQYNLKQQMKLNKLNNLKKLLIKKEPHIINPTYSLYLEPEITTNKKFNNPSYTKLFYNNAF